MKAYSRDSEGAGSDCDGAYRAATVREPDDNEMEQASSSMKIKSYFAASVEQAIQEARQELGTDAMLITSRRSSPETRSLGAYEVVFGLTAPTARQRSTAPAGDSTKDLSGELQSLRAQLQDIKSTLQGARPPDAPSSEAEELIEELVANDLARNIARETVAAAVRLREQLSRDQPASAITLRAYAAELVSKKLRFAPPFQQNQTLVRDSSQNSDLCGTRRRGQNHHADQDRDSRVPGAAAAGPHCLLGPLSRGRA